MLIFKGSVKMLHNKIKKLSSNFSYFLVSIFFWFLTGCSSSLESTIKTDLQKDGFKESVKSCELVRYNVVKRFGEYKKSKKMLYSINNFVSYHKSGKRMYEYFFTNSDVFHSICFYEYSSKGQLLKQTCKDGKGKITSLTKYYDNGSKKTQIHYDQNGKELYKIEEFLNNGLVVKAIEWKYFSGIQAKNPSNIKTFLFDKRKRLIREAELDIRLNKPKEKIIIKYIYDDQDKLIKSVREEHCGNFFKIDYTDSALQIEKDIFKYNEYGDLILTKIEIKYPLNKDVKSQSSSLIDNNSKFKQFRNFYTYDKSKNWVKKVEFENGKPICITERKLVYY